MEHSHTPILTVLLATALVATAEAQPGTAIAAAVERHAPEAIALRHRIHQCPELNNREFETAKLVAPHLRALGLEATTGVAHTGVVGVLPRPCR
jgi:amidohydrolase